MELNSTGTILYIRLTHIQTVIQGFMPLYYMTAQVGNPGPQMLSARILSARCKQDIMIMELVEPLMVLIHVNLPLKTGTAAAHTIIPGSLLMVTPLFRIINRTRRLYRGHLSVTQKWC